MMSRYRVFYSSPSEYTQAKNDERAIEWTVKRDDFMPYADCPHWFVRVYAHTFIHIYIH